MKQLFVIICGVVIIFVVVLVLLTAVSWFASYKHDLDTTKAAQKIQTIREANTATAQAITATAQTNIANDQNATATALVGTTTAQNNDATATVTATLETAIKQGEYVVTEQSRPLIIKAGQSFTIVFTLQNIGSHDWSATNGYRLACIDDAHNIPCPSPTYQASWCSSVVPPKGSCDFDVILIAPTHKGVYKAVWQLQHNDQSVASQKNPYMFVVITVV